MDMCIDMGMDMVHRCVCEHVHRRDVCVDMCMDMCSAIGMCIATCIGKCTDMCINMQPHQCRRFGPESRRSSGVKWQRSQVVVESSGSGVKWWRFQVVVE